MWKLIIPLLLIVGCTHALSKFPKDSWDTEMNPLYVEKERIAIDLWNRMNKEPIVKFLLPPKVGGDNIPLNLTIGVKVQNIFKIDKTDKMWFVTLILRHEWVDRRLTFTPKERIKHIHLEEGSSHIWVPDLCFREEVMPMNLEHKLMKKNELVRIHPDGKVLFLKRITLHLHCPLVHSFVEDKTFICPLSISSCGHTKDELDILWKVDHPIVLSPKLKVPMGFTLNKVDTKKEDRKLDIGTFKVVTALFNFGHDVCHI